MSKNKTTINLEEIDEIINLYIESQGGFIPELKFKAISDFNVKIVNNKYKRKNGELFILYKYNFWGGSYKGEYNYGKQRIIELNEKNKVQVVGREFNNEIIDIITLINDLHKKPQELTKHLISIFEKERKKHKEVKKELALAKEINLKLESKINTLENGITNLFFQSNSPNTSLDSMMSLSKSADSVCYDEFKNMFGNTDRFKRTQDISMEYDKSVVSIDELNKLRRLKELEDDGF